MENKEAIEALKLINLSRVHPFYSWEEMKEVRDVAISALEKQIPKKVISFKRTAHDSQNDICKHSGYPCDHIKTFNIEYQYADYKCPVCGKIATDGEPSYCWNCGQALDWSDTE